MNSLPIFPFPGLLSTSSSPGVSILNLPQQGQFYNVIKHTYGRSFSSCGYRQFILAKLRPPGLLLLTQRNSSSPFPLRAYASYASIHKAQSYPIFLLLRSAWCPATNAAPTSSFCLFSSQIPSQSLSAFQPQKKCLSKLWGSSCRSLFRVLPSCPPAKSLSIQSSLLSNTLTFCPSETHSDS